MCEEKKNKKYFSKYGITTRIVALFGVLVIIPFLLITVLVIGIFRDYNTESLGKAAMDSISTVGYQISFELKNRKESSMFVYYNSIVDMLSEEIDEKQEELIKQYLTSGVYSIQGTTSGVIVDKNGKTYGIGSYAGILTFMQEHQDEVLEAGGRCCWFETNTTYGKPNEYKYIMARSLNDENMEHVGFFYMVMGDSMIRNVFEQLKSDDLTRYLTDRDGNVLYCSEDALIGSHLDISALDGDKTTEYQKVRKSNGQSVIMVSRKIWDTGWYCIGIIEMETITQKVFGLLKPLLGLAVIYILFLFMMLYMMRKYIFYPLKILSKAMDQYAQDELMGGQIESIGVGELKDLVEHFNEMMNRIERLIWNYKKEVEEKNRQKLQVLSAQLTPHFIYNALNTIKWVAVLNHQEHIQKLIEALSYVLMNAARNEDEGYCLEDEFRLLENYAVIQKARFMNFELVIEKDEKCSECKIRKFLLQPIVENAVVHGLGRGKVKNTEIKIKAWVDDALYITIEDFGIGFDVEQWRNRPERKADHTNIGIKNIEEMIRIEYGENYGMWIESAQGEGTKVTYRLPAHRRDVCDTDDYCR